MRFAGRGVAHDVAVAGRVGEFGPYARLVPCGAGIVRERITAAALVGVADAHQPCAVAPLDEFRLVADGRLRDGCRKQTPRASAVVRAADVVVERRPTLSRAVRGDDERQTAVGEGQCASRCGEHAREAARCRIGAGGAVELRGDVLDLAPRQTVVGAAADADLLRRLGRGVPHAAAGGEDADDLLRVGVDDQRCIAVAAVGPVAGDDDLIAPRAAEVAAAPQHDVDAVGQVALRVVAAVGDGEQRAVGGGREGRDAVVLRAVVARAEEHRVFGFGGLRSRAAGGCGAERQQREEVAFHDVRVNRSVGFHRLLRLLRGLGGRRPGARRVVSGRAARVRSAEFFRVDVSFLAGKSLLLQK